MPGAGLLRERVAFDDPGGSLDDNGDPVLDDAGNPIEAWAESFQCAARVQHLKGSEPVLAQRLQGVQPVVITVRSSAEARVVDASWRARDVRRKVTYNIRTVTPSEDHAWIDFLCDSGVAV